MKSTSKNIRSLLVSFFLLVIFPAFSRGEDVVSYKYHAYVEDHDRVKVISHFFELNKDLWASTRVKVSGVNDTISGASPSGIPASDGSGKVQLESVEDERDGYVLDVGQKFGNHEFIFEFSDSKEQDYHSQGIALTSVSEFNKKNTVVSFGIDYSDDTVDIPSFPSDRKFSRNFFAGVSQIIDPQTVVTANISYGIAKGYLNDPYKWIQKNIFVNVVGLPFPIEVDRSFAENRPDRREKFITYLGINRHFEQVNGSIDASYRYFLDDADLSSHTWDLKWLQNLGGGKFVLIPSFRFYTQSKADFYYPTLKGTNIVPNEDPTGDSPHYSADYRLSEFDSYTYGLKLVYKPLDWLSVDAAIDRYEMIGRRSEVSSSNYVKANIYTLGVRAWF